MNEFNAEVLARLDAKTAIEYARTSGCEPVIFITGNSHMPPLRAFGHAEEAWKADQNGEVFEAYAYTFDQECERGSITVECPDYDNALYVVDLARFQYGDAEDAEESETLSGEWGPSDAVTAYAAGMVTGYEACAIWAGTFSMSQEDEPRPLDEEYDQSDISSEAHAEIERECAEFALANWHDLQAWDAEQAGHDFYLTRNGHGAGFWDRGKGAAGERLTSACRPYGTSDLYPLADGKLHLSH